MLTRLRVRGFKNLLDVDVRLGPLTCITGPNNVGKSNLFDALRFLGLLADRSFAEAAREVRGGESYDALATRGGDGCMSFLADMLIPKEGTDDFGRSIRAGDTHVRYEITLQFHAPSESDPSGRIALLHERLSRIGKAETEAIAFPHSREWLSSLLVSGSRASDLISTHSDEQGVIVLLHTDGRAAKTQGFAADLLPRTVLSSAQNGEEHRTAVLVRRELRNWRQLQLEPTSLRRPDELHDPPRLSASGAHLAASLNRLAREGPRPADQLYAEVANRLSGLIDGVRRVRVEKDDARRLLRFVLTDAQGQDFFASALSDGTLRFLALSVLEQDPSESGIVCLEEPENGIHPRRVRAMIDLLESLAVDAELAVDETNPLRQVLLTTHSPVVAAEVRQDALLFAKSRSVRGAAGGVLPGLALSCLPGTWRADMGMATISRGALLGYLRGNAPEEDVVRNSRGRPRVRDTYEQLDPASSAQT